MKAIDCAYEPEVVEAALTGGLAGREELRMHLETCDVCRDVLDIASMLRDDCDATLGDVHVPAAGQVWWRAAVRARLEAAHAAARPMTWAHGVAAASAAGLTAAALGIAWPTIERAATWFGERVGSVNPATIAVADLASSIMQRTAPFVLGAAFVVLAPLALYFALLDDGSER